MTNTDKIFEFLAGGWREFMTKENFAREGEYAMTEEGDRLADDNEAAKVED